MTDPTRVTDAPVPVPGATPEPTAWAPPDSNPWAPRPWDPSGPPTAAFAPAATFPPPAPVPVPVKRSGGFGGGRVPGALVMVLAPVLAVVMFAGGVFAERSGALGTASVAVATPRPAASGDGGTADLDVVNEAWKTIHDNYVDPQGLDEQELAYGAIRGMTEAVGDDGHTSFMTAEQATASEQSLSGSFVGIGVQVSEDDESQIQISTVFPGTPAEEAGLRRGDRIVAVDGKTTADETVDQTVSRVRGPEGEQVTLTLERAGTPNFDVTITRREFDLPLISWAMVPGTDVALIRLEQFATGATASLKQAITDARAQGATGIVFDLRSNPGGYVNEAIGVTSQFVGDGIVYQSFDRSGERKDGKVEPGGLATDTPVVVLANGDSASSAEIVTGAIQDAKRGTFVGEKTFGTGTVLGRFDLSDGSSMRIGVERWLTRGGRAIWREGLDPDVKVVLADDAQPLIPDTLREMSASDFAASTDEQVKTAVELLTTGG